MINTYLDLKARASRWIAVRNGPKTAKLPTFATIQNLANYMGEKFKYVPDPFGGALDFYTHPERTQYEIENKTHAYPCDCDDYAVYTYAVLSQMPGYEPKLITLVDGWIKWSHVVCVAQQDGRSHMIDTNGYTYLGSGMTEAQEHAVVLETVRRYYPKGRYFSVVETEYPFA